MGRHRLSMSGFCAAVREAMNSLPEALAPYLENVTVDVLQEPTRHDYDVLDRRGTPVGDGELLGVFHGVPLTEQPYGAVYPNRIRIFRRPLLEVSPTAAALKRNIVATVLHELAHHFGFSEEDLEDFERRQDELDELE